MSTSDNMPSDLCSPWITGDEVEAYYEACTGNVLTSTPVQLDDVAFDASWLLYQLTARMFPGVCESSVRPCQGTCGCWGMGDFTTGLNGPWLWGYWGGLYGGGWFWRSNEDGRPCGCSAESRVKLSGYVREILEVLIGGVPLPATDPVSGAPNYRLDRNKWLVRLWTPNAAAPNAPTVNMWPGCFAAGTLIQTDRGLRPIEDVRVGDRVLTHRNRWRKVVWAGKTGDSEVVTVSGRGGKVTCTPDHRFWVERLLVKAGQWAGEGHEWVEAADLEGCAWSVPSFAEPLPVPLPFPDVPDNFWSFIGRWVGDGWTDKANRVTICCGLHERDELVDLLTKTGWRWRESGGSSGGSHDNARFRFQSAALARWLREQFGTSAHDKELPAWILGMPENDRRDFLEGYVSADGWRGTAASGRGRPYTSIHTVSRRLAFGVRVLAGTLGHFAMLYEGHAGSDPRTVTYRVNWPEAKPGTPHSQARVAGDHLVGRVKSVRSVSGQLPVYDLTVEEDHSFVADGIVVHNCQNMNLEPDQPGTFEITYTWGHDVPTAGLMAAKELAVQLWLACVGAAECALNPRVTKIVRQNIEIDRSSIFAQFWKSGSTGIPLVDQFIAGVNPNGQRRAAAIWTPDREPFARVSGRQP